MQKNKNKKKLYTIFQKFGVGNIFILFFLKKTLLMSSAHRGSSYLLKNTVKNCKIVKYYNSK